MTFHNRLLVGMHGEELDPHLICYASMVHRLRGVPRRAAANRPSRPVVATAWPSNSARADSAWTRRTHEPEVRFVSVLPGRRSARPVCAAEHRSALRAHLHVYFRGLPEYSIGCDILKGRAIERLPAFAADFDSDLMLLQDDAWSRSECARLAMQAPCSVWFVPPGWAPVVRRVLVPFDFSSRSLASLQAAINLVRSFPVAKCLVLHVFHQDSRFPCRTAASERRHELESAVETLTAACDTRRMYVEPLLVECHCPDRAIAQAARQHGVDLIVMATRGRSRAARWILPSVTERTIHLWSGALLVLKSPGAPLGFASALREQLRDAAAPQFS